MWRSAVHEALSVLVWSQNLCRSSGSSIELLPTKVCVHWRGDVRSLPCFEG